MSENPRVVMYTRPFCMYCMAARNLLTKLGVDYEEIKVGRSGPEFDAMVERCGGPTTVPQIFIGEHRIGGYDELADLDRQGRLDELLTNGSF